MKTSKRSNFSKKVGDKLERVGEKISNAGEKLEHKYDRNSTAVKTKK